MDIVQNREFEDANELDNHLVEDAFDENGRMKLHYVLQMNGEQQEEYAREIWRRGPVGLEHFMDGVLSTTWGAFIAFPFLLVLIPILVVLCSGLFFLEYVQHNSGSRLAKQTEREAHHP